MGTYDLGLESSQYCGMVHKQSRHTKHSEKRVILTGTRISKQQSTYRRQARHTNTAHSTDSGDTHVNDFSFQGYLCRTYYFDECLKQGGLKPFLRHQISIKVLPSGQRPQLEEHWIVEAHSAVPTKSTFACWPDCASHPRISLRSQAGRMHVYNGRLDARAQKSGQQLSPMTSHRTGTTPVG